MPAEPADTAGAVLTESILGFVVSQAIHVAAVLGIADLLVEGPQSASRLAVMALLRCPDGVHAAGSSSSGTAG